MKSEKIRFGTDLLFVADINGFNPIGCVCIWYPKAFCILRATIGSESASGPEVFLVVLFFILEILGEYRKVRSNFYYSIFNKNEWK